MHSQIHIGIIASSTRQEKIVQKLLPLSISSAAYVAGEQYDLILIDEKKMSPGLLSRIGKNKSNPSSVIFFYEDGFKYWNYLSVKKNISYPHIISYSCSTDDLRYLVQEALDLNKKRKRTAALVDGQDKNFDFLQNPALNLITNIIKNCTQVESLSDIPETISPLQNIINFHESIIVETDENIAAFSESKIFFPNDEIGSLFKQCFLNPFSIGIVLNLGSTQMFSKSKIKKNAFLFLLKQDLVPFNERDLWIMDLVIGPLKLALEKALMLQVVNKSSKEWRSTFDAISEPITVINQDYEIIKANKAFANLVGQDIKRVKGKKCYTLLTKRRSTCLDCPANKNSNDLFGRRILGKEKNDLLAWSYAIEEKKNKYYFQFYRNVSKETELAGKLIQSEKMAALGKLVGAIAHEINNPLAGILATSQLMLDDLKNKKSAAEEDIFEIQDAAQRSKKIIDNLLGFTSNDQNQKDVNVNECILMALTLSKSAIRNIHLKKELALDLPSRKIPPSSLQQIVFNLVTNASHAMNGIGDISIKTEQVGEKILISILDSGPGISSERLKIIFDPFHTTKAKGKGTGLGLSIVRNLVHKMGGQISVDSVLNVGTKFVIEL